MARMIPLFLAEDEENTSSVARQRVFRDLNDQIVMTIWNLFDDSASLELQFLKLQS